MKCHILLCTPEQRTHLSKFESEIYTSKMFIIFKL